MTRIRGPFAPPTQDCPTLDPEDPVTMTQSRRPWLLLLAPLLLLPAGPLRAEPVPIPIEGLPLPDRSFGPLFTRMLDQAEVPPLARPMVDTLRRGLERGSLSAEEVAGLQRSLMALIQSLPAAMGGRP